MTPFAAVLVVTAVVLPVALAVAIGLTALGRLTEKEAGRHPVFVRFSTRWALPVAPTAVLPALLVPLAAPGAHGEVPWLLLGTVVQVDGLMRPLLLVTSLLYAAALVATCWVGRAPSDLPAFLLASHAGTVLIIIAGDVQTFYLGYVLMSLAAYGLVVHYRTEAARRAGRVYIVLTVISEAAVLGALLLIAAAGGRLVADAPSAAASSEHTGWIIGLLVLGFGIKAGLFPLHVWLPLAHPAAPPAASAVMSGAMVKGGLVGWLRFMPLGELSAPQVGTALVLLSLLGAFLAVFAGELQKDPKVVLAYSTISQMGFLGALVGVALADPELAPAVAPAAIVYAAHHALAKGTLFLGVPVYARHRSGWRKVVVLVGLAGAALAVAGAPLSSGSVGKYAAKSAVGSQEVLGLELVALLPLVATGSTVLLLRAGWLMYKAEPDPQPGVDAVLGAWIGLVATGITVPWLITDRWLPVTDVPGLEAVTLWDASWPILLGVALASIAVWLSWRHLLPGWAASPDGTAVPPGDIVVPEERLATAAVAGARDLVTRERAAVERAGGVVGEVRPLHRVGSVVLAGEKRLTAPAGSGLLLLAAAVVLVVSGVVG